MSYQVRIQDVTKKYGEFIAVDQVNLEVKAGELFTLLGPSGCGKTTLLRMIAGFNTIEGGQIAFGEKVMNQVPAHKRDIGMVFQNYAIFPHMTVAENVAYGLKAKKVPKGEIEEKVKKALMLVQIEQLKDRKPSELSGGQQQRVALARAIVIEPGILLMDEPLSNLDAKLRIQMRSTIRKLQKDLGITTIYVTHDQEEALAISDKIAVMKEGKIAQIGTPEEIYKKPQSLFVAGFIGTSNFLKCQVEQLQEEELIDTSQEGLVSYNEKEKGERYEEEKGHGEESAETTVKIEPMARIMCDENLTIEMPLKQSYVGEATLSVRPGQLKIGDKGMAGKVLFATFLGEYVAYEVALDRGEVVEVHEYLRENLPLYEVGQRVYVGFDPSLVSLYDERSQEAISW